MSAELVERREPWDRQPGESAAAFGQFVIYRDLGADRSLAKVAQIVRESSGRRGTLGSVTTAVSRLSGRHAWVDRAAAYDVWADRATLAARQRAIAAMEERHVGAGQALVLAGLARAQGATLSGGKVVEQLEPGAIESWGELARVLELGVKIERLARGLPTDITHALSHVSKEQHQRAVVAIVEAMLPFVPEMMQDDALAAAERVLELLARGGVPR